MGKGRGEASSHELQLEVSKGPSPALRPHGTHPANQRSRTSAADYKEARAKAVSVYDHDTPRAPQACLVATVQGSFGVRLGQYNP